MEREKILGYDVCTIEEQELLKNIFQDFENNVQNFIVNINPEIIIQNYENEELKTHFNSQKYQIPDGIGIIMASKIKKGKIRKRITGIDFMQRICKESVEHNAKIFLYGAKEGVAELAKSQLEERIKGINIVGVSNGYVSEEEAFEKIKKEKPDIVFVGLGSPKQENFIYNYKEKLNDVRIFMPVGGSFDVISKRLKRAPEWVVNMNVEWFYRLFKQPWRIFRQVKLLKFVFLVIKERKEENKNAKN